MENQLQLGNDLEVTESQDLNAGGTSDKKDLDRSKVSDKKKSVELQAKIQIEETKDGTIIEGLGLGAAETL